MDHLRIGVAIQQHHFLALQPRRQGHVTPTSDDHRAVGHVIGGKRQFLHASLEAIGTGKNIDGAVTQGENGLFASSETHYLHGHRQCAADQAQVVGANALIAIAITGDVDRLVIGNRDTHAKGAMLIEPLLILRTQDHRRQTHKGRHQTERQTLRSGRGLTQE